MNNWIKCSYNKKLFTNKKEHTVRHTVTEISIMFKQSKRSQMQEMIQFSLVSMGTGACGYPQSMGAHCPLHKMSQCLHIIYRNL